jgi:hypothetical protein
LISGQKDNKKTHSILGMGFSFSLPGPAFPLSLLRLNGNYSRPSPEKSKEQNPPFDWLRVSPAMQPAQG